ncbi:MAG: 2-oxoisovalerate dehydrogenase [Defluviitaleaceae bacterium]|nr:2-oxoisovalerate dehydrogenase [Defluviitaleaceae bacterium]
MVNEIIFTITESLDGGYEAQAIGHPIFTQSDTYAELPEVLRDAVKCHFDEGEAPALIHIHFVRHEVIAV